MRGSNLQQSITSSDPDQLYFQAENAIQGLLDYCTVHYGYSDDSTEIDTLNRILNELIECHENSELDFIYNNNLDGDEDIYND